MMTPKEKIKEIILGALTRQYTLSPIEKTDRVYANIEIVFRKEKQQAKQDLFKEGLERGFIKMPTCCDKHLNEYLDWKKEHGLK